MSRWHIDHREDNNEQIDFWLMHTCRVTAVKSCQSIRLANVGKNHSWNDALEVSACEIFRTLIE
jgi:hypothetical protein